MSCESAVAICSLAAQAATVTLLTIPHQAAREAAVPLAREAAAALADCATNAAPYEQRDFARRLSQLGTENPPLART